MPLARAIWSRRFLDGVEVLPFRLLLAARSRRTSLGHAQICRAQSVKRNRRGEDVDFWNNTTALERAALLTPYIFIVLGALVAVGGLLLKGVVDKRIGVLDQKADHRSKTTPPEISVKLGTATSEGENIVGRTLLQVTPENDVEFNASWLVTTHNNTVVSAIMTAQFHIVPAATPVFRTPVTINDEKVVDEYIELRFRYESVHSAELGNPDHLRGETRLPFRYAHGRVYPPTPEMLDHWRRSLHEPPSRR